MYCTEHCSFVIINTRSHIFIQGFSRFSKLEDPHMYFQMMFLTGQFEAAIDALYASSKYAFHAVHIAIALNQLGLLVLPDNLSRPIR
jgi:nuclear pore complex protein Nup93